MNTNHYQCRKCKKACDAISAAVYGPEAFFDPSMQTQEPVSNCCGQPVVVHSGKDW